MGQVLGQVLRGDSGLETPLTYHLVEIIERSAKWDGAVRRSAWREQCEARAQDARMDREQKDRGPQSLVGNRVAVRARDRGDQAMQAGRRRS